MKAVTWQGRRKVSVEDVPTPSIQEPTDAVIKVTSTAICGSDLHLSDPLTPFMTAGDILGHEPMGVVVEVGSAVTQIKPGDRVVIPFNISCGYCWMCTRGLYAHCETSQGTGAALFGFSALYGSVPGGQAQYLRVPQAHFGPIKVPDTGPDEQYLFLSDVVSTAWQGCGTPTPRRGNPRGVRAWTDRADRHPDRPPPRGGTGHRPGSGP